MQIILYYGKSATMHTFISAKAITEVDQIEYKWKIKTNGNKFQSIAFGKKRPSVSDFKIEQ